ncbi:MAG: SDR family oxidoreductase [Chloroflexi bacterium]|nr:SDR family oxidoreductase [Chloroflexota bacterium]
MRYSVAIATGGGTDVSGQRALVTGASRGIGAAVAQRFAQRGVDVVLNYREKAQRAEVVAAAIRSTGSAALPIQADITDEGAVAAMFQQVGKQLGSLHYLILNASGGLEQGVPGGYALRLNRDAQVRAVELALPLLRPGGRIVFVTSHFAHFYGQKPVLAAYAPVAASKHAGEAALREQIPELATRGLSLVVVSGDLIEGTITPRLLQRASPGLIEARRQEAGWLPTIDDFAAAIVAAAMNPALASGTTIYVGSTEWEFV